MTETEKTINTTTAENNNIIIDLLIKNSKITTILNLMLEHNNIMQLETAILENQEYQILQDNIIHSLDILNKQYIKLMEDVKNAAKKENN